MMTAAHAFLLLALPALAASIDIDATVTTDSIQATTNENFVCWNIDSSANRGFFWRNLSSNTALGHRVSHLASQLSAAQPGGSILRFGGTGNDHLTYLSGGPCGKDDVVLSPGDDPTKNPHCLNSTTWADLAGFTRAAGAKMVFALNLLQAYGSSKTWNPENARAFMEFAIKRGDGDLFFGFELGNEENDSYSGQQQALAVSTLYHGLLVPLWAPLKGIPAPKVLGPDPHSFHTCPSAACSAKLAYIADFLHWCSVYAVPLAAMTHHEYVDVGDGSPPFRDPSRLDQTSAIASAVYATVAAAKIHPQVWAGEIGPHNGGSPPCDHTSMRWANFGDSLWYSDALASKARNGYSAFCRQDLIGADYGLLDCATGLPLPDYFTGLLFARLMGPRVLDVRATRTGDAIAAAGGNTVNNGTVRFYAHCGRAPAGSGAVALLIVNLGAERVNATLLGNGGWASRTEYHLASTNVPGPVGSAAGILGSGILLNGDGPLALTAAGALPSMKGRVVASSAPLSVGPASILFAEFPEAFASACQ